MNNPSCIDYRNSSRIYVGAYLLCCCLANVGVIVMIMGLMALSIVHAVIGVALFLSAIVTTAAVIIVNITYSIITAGIVIIGKLEHLCEKDVGQQLLLP